jgi:hypothetical protein
MYKLLLFACTLFLQVTAVAEPVREVSFRGADLAPTNTRPTFDHGYLAVYGRDKIDIYAPDGSFSFSFAPPHGGLTMSVAVDADGTVAAAIGFVPTGYGPGIAILDRTGALQTYVATQPYSPTQVCFAPDHSIWTIGSARLAETQDYFVLRHYSREGKELGAFLPRSTFDKAEAVEPGESYVGAWSLRAAKDRIGAYLHSVDRKMRAAWVEVGLDGKELGRWKFPEGFGGSPSAFTRSGAIFAADQYGLFLLDRSTGMWNPVSPASDGRLLGADGDDLVFWIRDQARLRYVPAEAQ